MADKNIIHMVTPTKHVSPFDMNMALDAGYDAALAYTNVTLEEVTALVQDAIFSRPPKLGARTAMFFGGKNASVALDMVAKAKSALVPPFAISLFADPAGSFTTAAAMVACVEKLLKDKKQRDLKGLKVAVFGATGVVGFASAVIAALQGSDVTLVGYDGINASAMPPRRSNDASAWTCAPLMAATTARSRPFSPNPERRSVPAAPALRSCPKPSSPRRSS